ncbi:MAG: hypothetical protein K1X53_02130 [Candidatus Sumerlaeaceae bacterium]|nr:hypothetical protein [Candidatus Sumerlaeaceae bacterium]
MLIRGMIVAGWMICGAMAVGAAPMAGSPAEVGRGAGRQVSTEMQTGGLNGVILAAATPASGKRTTTSAAPKPTTAVPKPVSTTPKPASAPATTPQAVPPAASPASSASKAQSIGAVRPSNLVLPQLGISIFDGDPQAAGVGQIIQNDLVLGDIAQKPTNESAASQALRQDQQSGSVNMDGWATAGVSYVVRGRMTGTGVEAELYDIASKARVFGKSYTGFSNQNVRRAAHKIADDVMTAVSNMPGIFSTQVCYLAGGSTKEIHVMDADGGSDRQISNERSIVTSPCWGENGTEIYFTSYRDNNPDLYGITLGGNRFEISRRPGLNTAPSWSEAAQRLAVSLSKDGNSEIYTMSRDGRDLARLTNSSDANTAPDWSPDGSRIAFTSDRGGSPQIYLMSSSGGSPQKISGGNYSDSPAWSPDGSKVAFVTREGGEFNIYVASVAGGPAVQLTRGQRDNEDPSWGPSSHHLVFSSNRGGAKDIYMMNIDTKRAHQLTRGGSASQPSWSPASK